MIQDLQDFQGHPVQWVSLGHLDLRAHKVQLDKSVSLGLWAYKETQGHKVNRD